MYELFWRNHELRVTARTIAAIVAVKFLEKRKRFAIEAVAESDSQKEDEA